MALKNFGDVDLCETCLVTVEYGGETFPAVSANLGVVPAFFDTSDDIDGSTLYRCDGCREYSIHGYTGILLTESDF